MKLTTKKLYKLIQESLSENHREKLIMLLLSNIEGAEQAFELMEALDLDDVTIIDIINDAINSDPQMAKNPNAYEDPLQQRLKREINMRLMKGLEGFDLGDFNER
jgi:O-phosphoseryl-tRNA(Cys) synthetase